LTPIRIVLLCAYGQPWMKSPYTDELDAYTSA